MRHWRVSWYGYQIGNKLKHTLQCKGKLVKRRISIDDANMSNSQSPHIKEFISHACSIPLYAIVASQ